MLRSVQALAVVLVLAGCAQAPAVTRSSPAAGATATPLTPFTYGQTALDPPAASCTNTFVGHELPHVTSLPTDDVRMFEANGSGVAINDLDDDGDLDVVLGNDAGKNTFLWNDGGLTFRKESMAIGDTRALTTVDVDGDDRLDLVLTRRKSGLNYWRNMGTGAGAGRFQIEFLPGVAKPAYAINWADPDRDGDLDMVAASYDAGLITDLGSTFLLGGGAGVYYYENQAGKLVAKRLAGGAQALAVAFYDFTGDDAPDIVVGNDFEVYDQAWAFQNGGWAPTQPFARTSHSTMSLDTGDVDNDGDFELFSTDMKPYALDVDTLAVWQALMTEMWEKPRRGNPQIMENVLQVADGRGGFRNEAYGRRLDATGWSWSAKFGDLDNDGALDLYVVNGMAEAEIFRYLPRHELLEQNQALRNDGAGNFVPVLDWGLGSTLGGRGMSMGDLDGDGDLDIVVNNLRGPAMLYENRLCGGSSLQLDLRWPGSKNTRAIGAVVALHTDAGVYYRDVRAASGYLSGDPARLHFGVPAGAALQKLEIRWPDGGASILDDLSPQTRLTVTRR